MSVSKDKNGVWRFRIWIDLPDGTKKQVKKENKSWSKKDALLAEQKFKESICDNSTNINLQDLFIMFINSKQERIKKRSILAYQEKFHKHILPFFSKTLVSKISKLQIRRWQKELLDSGLSNSYILAIQSIFREILKWAENNDYIERSPFTIDFVRNIEHKKEMLYFNLEEFYKFRNVIEDEIDLIIFDLLYWCGIRKGELMALKFSDFDILNRSIHISKSYDNRNRIITSPKSRSSYREIILVKPLFDILLNYTEKSEQLDCFDPNLFLIGIDAPISSTTLERRKNKYCRLAQVKQIRIHDFRHSHVSLLISNNFNDFAIAKRLGHSRDMVNNRYGHWFRKDQQKMVEELDRLIDSQDVSTLKEPGRKLT